MDWLFERMIELAAWVALVLGIVFLCDSILHLAQWFLGMSSSDEIDRSAMLAQSGQAAIKFVAASLAMGTLAVIDRYVFDLDENA